VEFLGEVGELGGGLTHRWRRQRLSALIVSQLFGFVGGLVQNSGFANPALRLSFSVKATRSRKLRGRLLALTGRRL
jgi:hypothetical protein